MPVNKQRYYFDANALWKFYRNEKGSLEIHRLVSNSPDPIILSTLTSIEFINVLMKYVRRGNLKRRVLQRIVKRYRRNIGVDNLKPRPFTIIQVPENSFVLAEKILLQYAGSSNIGSQDALHLAIAAKLQIKTPNITVVTSDNPMKNICNEMGLAIYDVEKINTSS